MCDIDKSNSSSTKRLSQLNFHFLNPNIHDAYESYESQRFWDQLLI